MKKVATMDVELTVEERNLLSGKLPALYDASCDAHGVVLCALKSYHVRLTGNISPTMSPL